jgi:hypothetical protein
MNDPKVIEWLESTEGEAWRRETFRLKHLLVLTLKEDMPCNRHGKPVDVPEVIGGYVPEDWEGVPSVIQQVNCG